MKKIFKSMLLFMAVAMGVSFVASCNDDDNLPAMDGLFRPVINESDNITHGLDEDNNAYMIINWDNYKTANQYTVKIEASDGSDTREVVTDTTFYRFDNLKYDKEYNISLIAGNTSSGLQSKPFTLTTTSLDYPTSLSTLQATDIIDNAARIRWSAKGDYDYLRVYKDSNDSLVKEVTLDANKLAALSVIVDNLQPRTAYRVEAYKGDSYRGKRRFTTVASESFSGAVIDLRSVPDSVTKTYFSSEQLAYDVEANAGENLTYVLKGGFQYKVSGGTALPSTTKKIKFVTGLTLEGNAIFLQSGGFTMASEAQINEVEYEKIDVVSDRVNSGDYAVETNHDKGWGGRQVFNVNGTKATMKSLTYNSCSFTGYRAVCRAQAATDAVNNITFNNCLINCIGDQGVITTTNREADWQSVTMRDCTITNIVMLCDLRSTLSTLKFTIENCTFCYAPIETTANANTPMFRLGSGNVDLTIKNTLFGPSMMTLDSSGGDIYPYQAGTVGSILLSGTPANLNVDNSYKSNFIYVDMNTTGEGDPKIYPIEGLGELSLSEKDLWSNPAGGEFNIVGSQSGVDLKTLGDSRWQ